MPLKCYFLSVLPSSRLPLAELCGGLRQQSGFVCLLQDLLMVTYLANLTQAQISLNEKLVLL